MIFDANLVGKKQSVVDELLLLNQHQIPLITFLGGFGRPVKDVTHTWYEAETSAKSDVINNGGDVAAGATSITVTDGTKFKKDLIVQNLNSDELVEITNVAGNVLTVVRGVAGTTPAIMTDGTQLNILYPKGTEGADARAAKYDPRTAVDNYTQIFDDSIEITGTAQEVEQYGIRDLYETEKMLKLTRLALDLENAVINGVKYRSGATSYMNGIRSYIASNILDASNADITMAMLNTAVQDVKSAGGFETGGLYAFMMPSVQVAKVNELYKDNIVTPLSDGIVGRAITAIRTNHGVFNIIENDNLHTNEILFLYKDRIEIKPLGERGFFHKYLGATGDSDKGMVLGEYTVEFKQESAHSRIANLKIT